MTIEIAVDKTLESAETKAKQVPKPTGYHILCMVPELNVDKTYDGTILKPDTIVSKDEQMAIATVVLFVVEVGDMAYADKEKFPTGPWCKKGDFVLVRAYSGTRFKVHGTEFRIINDDTVEAVVEDPRGLSQIGRI